MQELWSIHLDHSRLPQHFPGGAGGKESTCQCRRCKRHGFDPWVGEIPLEMGMATHSSIFAQKTLWTEEPGGLQSMGSQRVGHDLSTRMSVWLKRQERTLPSSVGWKSEIRVLVWSAAGRALSGLHIFSRCLRMVFPCCMLEEKIKSHASSSQKVSKPI